MTRVGPQRQRKKKIAFEEKDDRQGRGNFTTKILLNILNRNINSGTESEE